MFTPSRCSKRLFESPSSPPIDDALWRRPDYFEAAALAFCLFFALGLAYLHETSPIPIAGTDFHWFMEAANGNLSRFFYPQWSLVMFAPLAMLNFTVAYFIWNVVNIMAAFIGGRIFGGNLAIALLSYQMLYSLYYGQITGLIILGLATYWWCLQRDQFLLAGVGAVLALCKPQMSVPLLLAMALVLPIGWPNRIRTTVVPFVVLGLSLLVSPNWIIDLLERVRAFPPTTVGSITLWDYFGPLVIVLWVPVLLFPMPPIKRLIAVAAVSSLALPYYQHTGLVMLFALPVGYAGLLGNVGYLMVPFRWQGLEWVTLAPLMIYLWVVIRHSPCRPN